jgi:hypothetical protein
VLCHPSSVAQAIVPEKAVHVHVHDHVTVHDCGKRLQPLDTKSGGLSVNTVDVFLDVDAGVRVDGFCSWILRNSVCVKIQNVE